ncbi:MAG TPA: hypothetical protein VFP44_10395 [Usitatibacter sp.]|nr:hypothetical protein [Usitatibacter sp.]
MDLPGPGLLFASLFFGVVGFAAFTYGRKQARFSAMVIGAVLMVYPYFVSRAWLLWSIGLALCASLYVFRDY